jgi:hypothetical protein
MSENAGVIAAVLIWSGGVDLDTVQYTLTGSNGDLRSGALESGTPGFPVSDFQIGGVPAGVPYTLRVFGSNDAGASCLGMSPVWVTAKMATVTSVEMICTYPSSSSPPEFPHVTPCASWQSIQVKNPDFDAGDGGSDGGVGPPMVFVGDTLTFDAEGNGPSPDLLMYTWSSSLPIGSFGPNMASRTSDETTFTCTAPGTTTITLVVSESDNPDASDCPPSLTTVEVAVVCAPSP